MPSQKSCPTKFGSAVNTGVLLHRNSCCGKDCEWFFDNHWVIHVIAKELCTLKKEDNERYGAGYSFLNERTIPEPA